MNIKKIETNYNRKLFLESCEIKPKKYKENIENQVINIYPEIEYQEFIGFGGAITQAVGTLYNQLSPEKKKEFLKEYFMGCNYELCRIPIGSCDFSPEEYSYSNKKDLSDFSIQKDEMYIIPILKDILKLNPNLKLLASPWSPPKFMKTNKMLILGGRLLEKYYWDYAVYLMKYLNAYKEQGINIEYITIQNEPNAMQRWESCLFSAEEESKFIKEYLYPMLVEHNIKTKILIYDQNRDKLYDRAKYVFDKCDNECAGVAFHWYTGDHFESLEITKKIYPKKLLIHSEICVGYSGFNESHEIMNAEKYAHDIIGDLNNGCNGYIDWNILLDYYGGPNHKRNYCNSPIMLNKDKNDYYKNLCFYYIKQFSTVILPGAVRIGSTKYTDKIEVTAFKNTDGSTGIVLLNRDNKNYEYNLHIEDCCIHDNLDSHAIVSYLIN